MNFIPRTRAAFQPPSDMGSSGGSGGNKRKLWLGLGIGCGVILILTGILFAAGAFKAVSCCNTVKDVAEGSVAAQEFGQRFANAAATGDTAAAYAMTSDAFQQSTSEEAFKQVVSEHRARMETNTPRLFDMQMKAQDGASLESLKQSGWRLSYQFAGPTDQEMLLLIFSVERDPGGAEGEASFVISDVMFDERPRDLAREAPATEVLEFHETLQRGNYEQAYARLAPAFQEETGFEAFRKFLDDAGEALTKSSLTIRQVDYSDDNLQSTIVAHAATASGADALVQYELVPFQPNLPNVGWRIVAIAPLVAEAPASPEPEASDAGADRASGDAGSVGPDDVVAPSVEVDEAN